MKKTIAILLTFALILSITACSGQENSPSLQQTELSSAEQRPSAAASQGSQTNTGENNILIAYFTRLENTDATLDEIVQGGGPYGSLGNSLEDADVDAVASASITMMDGETQGNVETMAQMIASVTGGALFSIQTTQKYPVNYDELIELGGEEKSQGVRPELETHVENIEEYDVIFLGYPNWWYDMPMAMYSFLEEYDFSRKTIIPFAASAGAGFSGTISTIQEMQPDATVVEDGLHIPMGDVAGGREQIEEWISSLEI